MAFALVLAATASAQTPPAPTSAPPSVADSGPGFGMLGDNYAEFDYSYLKNDGSPGVLHDYGFISNENITKQDIWGVDGDFKYDYLTGSAFGMHDDRNEAEFGFTGFVNQAWGRPFVSADGGWAWQRAAGVSGNSFAYSFTGGVEFQVMKRLVITPFAGYQAEPRLHDDAPAAAFFPNHEWEFGAKATYRLTRQLSASVGLEVDQHRADDLGFTAGLAYHY